MSKEDLNFVENLRAVIENWSKSSVGRANRWLKYIQHTPDLAHLLIRLSGEPDIPAPQKARLATTIAYLVSPMDLIPETYWGALGYLDDIVMAAFTLQDILEHVDHQLVLKHWESPTELIPLITEILHLAPEMLQPEYYQKLQALLNA